MRRNYWLSIFCIIMFLSCGEASKQRDRDMSIGAFLVDMDGSDSIFTPEEISYYSGVILELRKNGSFQFSRPVPVARGMEGKWRITGSEIERSIELNYSSGYSQNISPCSDTNFIITIQIPIYKNNMPIGTKILAFKKI